MNLEWPDIQIAYIAPSGIATLPVAGGAIVCRVVLGHIDASDTGLIREIEKQREPVPWLNKQVRQEAISRIQEREDLTEGERARLLKHIKKTPWYEEV